MWGSRSHPDEWSYVLIILRYVTCSRERTYTTDNLQVGAFSSMPGSKEISGLWSWHTRLADTTGSTYTLSHTCLGTLGSKFLRSAIYHAYAYVLGKYENGWGIKRHFVPQESYISVKVQALYSTAVGELLSFIWSFFPDIFHPSACGYRVICNQTNELQCWISYCVYTVCSFWWYLPRQWTRLTFLRQILTVGYYPYSYCTIPNRRTLWTKPSLAL